MMIQLFEQWLECLAQVCEIHNPPAVRTHLAADMHLEAEGMSVQARTFMAVGNIGQPVRGLNLKNSEYIHGRIVPVCRMTGNTRPLVVSQGIIASDLVR